MYIDYVLTEKCEDASQTAKKQRVRSKIQKLFPASDHKDITFEVKNKKYQLPYSITCSSATDNCSNDCVYNIHIEYESSNNSYCAQVLEKVHFKIMDYFSKEKGFHLIIANDGLSEYYCNKAYPKFQKFERLLRNLLFIVVTKAYGEKWVKETLPKDLQPKLNSNQLIESALTEMTMGQLIDYLFYGTTEVNFSDYIDDNFPPEKLSLMSNSELISLVEKGRPKSIWNDFLVEYIHIQQPKEKLNYIRNCRNNIAHCKQFYSAEYKKSLNYLDLLTPQIKMCLEKVRIKDDFSARDIVLGFGNFTLGLSEFAKRLSQAITPAIEQMAEIGQLVSKNLQETLSQLSSKSYSDVIKEIAGSTSAIEKMINYPAINTIAEITSSLPTWPVITLPSDNERFDSASNDERIDHKTETDEENKNDGSNK